ncbi:hypothetical protein [Agrobacterium sp. Ap1]|jgi:hypothetical protein|nr:hypothetical protein [Agrobacterium sp. Ap1]
MDDEPFVRAIARSGCHRQERKQISGLAESNHPQFQEKVTMG